MFIKVTNGTPENYTIGQLRRDNTNVGFPAIISDEMLAQFDVYRLHTKPVPKYDELTQRLQRSNFDVEGDKWWVHYTIEHFAQDIAERNVREHRNSLIAETDWMALSDNAMSPEWTEYRQALRDITEQKGFPYTVEWPIKPE